MPVRSKIPHFGDILSTSDLLDSEGLEVDKPTNRTVSTRGWWSTFNKETETGSPGLYSLLLGTPSVQAHMYATSGFSGLHSYEWLPPGTDGGGARSGTPGMVFDVCHGVRIEKPTESGCVNATLTVDWGRNEISATVWFANRMTSHPYLPMYFHAELVGGSGATAEGVIDKSDPVIICTDEFCKDKITVHSTDGTDGVFSINTVTGVLYAIVPVAHATVPVPTKVHVNVGLSFIDREYARTNLQNAMAPVREAHSLAEVEDIFKAAIKSRWCTALSGVLSIDETIPGDDDIAVMLHSASYRSMMSPTVYSENGTSGSYLGFDKTIHNFKDEFDLEPNEFTPTVLAEGDYGFGTYSSSYFSDLSLWDTFRTQHPWLLLTQPDVAVGVARSMLQISIQQGAFPRWTLASNDPGAMMGEAGTAVVVELVLAGLGDTVNASTIQEIVLRQSVEPVPLNGRTDVEHYIKYGYVSKEASGVATSDTLTYMFDDYLLSQLSYSVGDTTSGDAALARSKGYAVIWSDERQIMCPRGASAPEATGELACPRTPVGLESWNDHKEGDSLQWSLFVPHDVEGLIALHGRREPNTNRTSVFYDQLEYFFQHHVSVHEKIGHVLPNPYYWAGNEHDAFAVWMFSFGELGQTSQEEKKGGESGAHVGGFCSRTQYWSRRLTHMHFSALPNGVPGNEDYGAMATWLLFTSLGLFPQAGTTNFVIGSPRIIAATIGLDGHVARVAGAGHANSRFLHIQTFNNSAENVYVSRLFVNGEEHSSPFIDRAVLVQEGGCKLEFHMSDRPVSGICA